MAIPKHLCVRYDLENPCNIVFETTYKGILLYKLKNIMAGLVAINELLKIPLVKAFLDSSGRNSIKTRKSYASALSHLQNFLNQKYQGYNCETILKPLVENKISIYELLNHFVSYILMIMTTTNTKISSKSITFYLAALRSYFAYYDIDVIPSKFRRKVKVPKGTREDEQPIDVEDIRKILLSCHNRRLKLPSCSSQRRFTCFRRTSNQTKGFRLLCKSY